MEKHERLRQQCLAMSAELDSEANHFLPSEIVSGGQTGVDRGALDFAIEAGIPHTGWCPAGRLSENGRIPDRYQLRETESHHYAVRTEKNVLDSDATLVLYAIELRGGTRLTAKLAERLGRPFITFDLDGHDMEGQLDRVRMWLNDIRPDRLNIAGPRESNRPGVGAETRALLHRLFHRR